MLGAQSQAGWNPFLGQPSEWAHSSLSLLSREGSLECGSFLYISLYCAGPGGQMQGTPLTGFCPVLSGFMLTWDAAATSLPFGFSWMQCGHILLQSQCFYRGMWAWGFLLHYATAITPANLFWNINSSWNKSDIVLMSKNFGKFFEKNLNFLKYLFL